MADLYIKNHASYGYQENLDDYEIEEYDNYDSLVKEQNDFNDKEIAYHYKFDTYGKTYWTKFYENKNEKSRIIKFDKDYSGKYVCEVIVHCDNEEKAFKIACDMRAKKMAEHLGL